MEQIMRIVYTLAFIVPATLGLAACGSSPPPTQVIVQPAATTVVPASPMPPPPPMSEMVPPPPVSSTPTVWQPGHWRYTGISGGPWSWENGQYVAVPSGSTAWVPGQWQQQGSGWVWREGHWA
jgi:WXXGXW repeat (2 copies)